jgi:hypothetical protein
MTPGTNFPLKMEGITVLGCPIGTDTFCTHHIQKVVGTVERDLACLREFPFFHQRIKLAIYCCNTRPTYQLRSVSLHTSIPQMRDYDNMFDHFIAHTRAIEQNFASSPYAHRNARALQQCRLGIKRGGMGLTSAVLIAPAALHVALREFQTWYQDYAETWNQQPQSELVAANLRLPT